MKNILLLLSMVSLLAACNNEKKNDSADSKEATGNKEEVAKDPAPEIKFTALQLAAKPHEKVLGSFVGPFGDNRITLLVTTVAGDSVVGRSIVGGNDRPFRGTFVKRETMYTMSGKEPGDHKDDGQFVFFVDENEPDKLFGSWTAYEKGRPAKQYTLARKKFEYSTDVGTFPEASQRLLKTEDVENKMKEDLVFMRNEIFARHGYCFSNKSLRQRFEMEDWYVPNTVDIRGFLTDIEKKNIDLIKRYEKYADEYGDEYGR